jgi:hypothetical protein
MDTVVERDEDDVQEQMSDRKHHWPLAEVLDARSPVVLTRPWHRLGLRRSHEALLNRTGAERKTLGHPNEQGSAVAAVAAAAAADRHADTATKKGTKAQQQGTAGKGMPVKQHMGGDSPARSWGLHHEHADGEAVCGRGHERGRARESSEVGPADSQPEHERLRRLEGHAACMPEQQRSRSEMAGPLEPGSHRDGCWYCCGGHLDRGGYRDARSLRRRRGLLGRKCLGGHGSSDHRLQPLEEVGEEGRSHMLTWLRCVCKIVWKKASSQRREVGGGQLVLGIPESEYPDSDDGDGDE